MKPQKRGGRVLPHLFFIPQRALKVKGGRENAHLFKTDVHFAELPDYERGYSLMTIYFLPLCAASARDAFPLGSGRPPLLPLTIAFCLSIWYNFKKKVRERAAWTGEPMPDRPNPVDRRKI
ncbi:hypothetical protein I5Q82_12100 [Acutalibacter muris]|uniref:Uncharacterized protein n=1 Tax=Acutalibacter muris TaxID=1796620 RepID=A0AA92QV76_9FIRM|nr:hypothetical protein [Acutalibacter muris]QQR28837.1 hypothetical protein I5Q82_12100 [Acutalibacter muris]